MTSFLLSCESSGHRAQGTVALSKAGDRGKRLRTARRLPGQVPCSATTWMPETGDCRKQGSSGAQCWHCRGSGPRVSGMTPLNVTQRQQAGPAHPAGEALGHKPEPAPALEGREVEDWESSPHEQAELARSSVERGQRSRAGGHPGPPYIGGLQAALDLRSHVWMEMQTGE